MHDARTAHGFCTAHAIQGARAEHYRHIQTYADLAYILLTACVDCSVCARRRYHLPCVRDINRQQGESCSANAKKSTFFTQQLPCLLTCMLLCSLLQSSAACLPVRVKLICTEVVGCRQAVERLASSVLLQRYSAPQSTNHT